MLNGGPVNFPKILQQQVVPLQRGNLEHPSTPLGNAFEGQLLVDLPLHPWAYIPQKVAVALPALHGEASAVGSRGGVEALESLDLNPCSCLPEVDDTHVLEGRRRQGSGKSIFRFSASYQHIHCELVDKRGDPDWVEVGLRKGEHVRNFQPAVSKIGPSKFVL